MRIFGAAVCVALSGCADPGGWAPEEDVSDRLVVMADQEDGLRRPQDLAFHPDRPDELWIVNRADDSVTWIFGARGPSPRTDKAIDPYAVHFMDKVSSIAFGADNTFATCQDSRNTYGDVAPPDDFMGPALWSADLEVFASSNPAAVRYLSDLYGMPVDLGSHLDMLHESPLCVGIAWERDNVYWVFDGMAGDLVRYDFQDDHGVGYDDHSDGIIARYAVGQVERVEGTVGHLALDRDAGQLYVADPGNGRVGVLDIESGTRGRTLPAVEPGTDHHVVDGTTVDTLASDGFGQPAGLALVEGHLVVTDTATGHIVVLQLDGTEVARLDTGLPAGRLAGITGATLDDLWLVDTGGAVYRLQP